MQRIEIIPITGIPEVGRGADLAGLIVASMERAGVEARDGDVLVVKQKVVSKAEGRIVALEGVKPGRKARALAREHGKDPRLVELILREAVRVVRAGHGVIITETKHGLVCANSGVDQSNVGKGLAALLPLDPDRSAREIRMRLQDATRRKLAVIVTDTFGRPWRRGQTDVAIGCSGISPLLPYAGSRDSHGYKLRVTEPALVDEIAGAAELATGKLKGIPVAVIRGVHYQVSDEGVRSLVMPKERDLFR